MLRRQVAPCLVLVALLAGGCATSGGSSSGSNDTPTAEQVTFGLQLAEIRGHHLVAVKLYQAGDAKGAVTHTGHPVEELLATVETEVREKSARIADRLGPALQAPSQAIADRKPLADFVATIETAAAVVDQAEAAVLGPLRTSKRYFASVVAALTSTVAAEYAEALKDGKIALLAEYQDAYAFTLTAKSIYGLIERDVRRAAPKRAGVIADGFAALAKALASPTPPSDPAPLDDVEKAATHIGTELKETMDAVLLETVSTEDAFSNIDLLLDDVLTQYEAGDKKGAAESAAKAYLDNYEHVEGDVIKLAPDVNKELEPLLGAELRSKIREGVPQRELEALVARARALLKEARETLLAGEHESH